jgi:hypothetical protein
LIRPRPWVTSARRVFWKRLRFCAPIILAAPLGDFCTESLLEKTSILRVYYSGCTLRRLLRGESFGKDFDFAHLLCYSGCTLRRLLCGESFGKDFDFAHLLCYSGCTLRRLLRGVSHPRVVSAAPRSDFGVVECRRPSMRSFSTCCVLVFAGDFCGYITWLRLIKNLTPGRKRVWAGMILFGELQGRVSPEDSNKKFAEIIDIPGML